MVKTYEERIKEANDKRVKRLEKAREKYARDKANKNGIWAYQKERDKAKKEERVKIKIKIFWRKYIILGIIFTN